MKTKTVWVEIEDSRFIRCTIETTIQYLQEMRDKYGKKAMILMFTESDDVDFAVSYEVETEHGRVL